jgi:MoaA/NifB/PqqE/SkfB family radical SAM enzyme
MDKITYAYLETTNYCNLDCSFCNRDEVIGPLKHMSLENWGKLLDGIKHHPIKEAKLMGMGEPFLHPQFDEVCRMFKETFPKCKVIVATNCQYDISPGKKLRKVFENALQYIDVLYFSIDGYEDNYERDRAPAKWSKLIKFLDNSRKIDKQGCDIVVNYVVNAYNVNDIIKIDELRVNYDLGQLRLNIAQIWDEGKSIKDDIATSGYTKHQLDYLKENWGGKIMGRADWNYEDCFWVNNALYTTVEGNVKMCCMNTGAKPFGNLFVNSIDEIRQMTDYQNVKKGCNTNNPTSHCKNCSYKELSPMLKYLGV